MAVFFAYLSVVLIWATTPLAIQWSSDGLSVMTAVAARMTLALALALFIHAVLRNSIAEFWQHRKIYFAASLGIFPNMPLVYWAAQYIPSGLVAVLFAMSPFATGVMTLLILKHNPFSVKGVIALLLALSGLVVIFYHQLHFDVESVYGIAGILLSCVLFSFSSVWVKKLTTQAALQVAPFHQATGALLFALPGLILCWYLMDGSVPQQVSLKSAGAVVYLAVIGSLLGAILFFFILQRLSASAVSLITLMTPVLAIIIGKQLADEALSSQTLIGVSVVLFALLLYLPWSVRGVMTAVNVRLHQYLRSPALDEEGTSAQLELQKIKEYVIRFK